MRFENVLGWSIWLRKGKTHSNTFIYLNCTYIHIWNRNITQFQWFWILGIQIKFYTKSLGYPSNSNPLWHSSGWNSNRICKPKGRLASFEMGESKCNWPLIGKAWNSQIRWRWLKHILVWKNGFWLQTFSPKLGRVFLWYLPLEMWLIIGSIRFPSI